MVERRQDPHLVPRRGERAGEGLDVPGESARIVHEYGETRATRMCRPDYCRARAPILVRQPMPERHFVKYTFLKVDPAWRRLDVEERSRHKREFLAACEDFAAQRLLRAFSLVGTRGDADLLLLSQATNLERIHELHVVLETSGVDSGTSWIFATAIAQNRRPATRLEARPRPDGPPGRRGPPPGLTAGRAAG